MFNTTNIEELKLFRKYNNELERGVRTKDFFYLDSPNMNEKEKKLTAKKNLENLIELSKEQIEDYPNLFKGDGLCL